MHIKMSVVIILVGLCFVNCKKGHDLGKLCGTSDPTQITGQIISGEEPLLEVVRVERDSNCESFLCLTQAGLTPQCSRSCTSESKEQGDCPNGFVCRIVQEAGPLSQQSFCVPKMACEKNLDCNDVGTIECVDYVCFDVCLLAGTACNNSDSPCASPLVCEQGKCSCKESHTRTCKNKATYCQCPASVEDPNYKNACADKQLKCKNPETNAVWPDESAEQQPFCLRDQDT